MLIPHSLKWGVPEKYGQKTKQILNFSDFALFLRVMFLAVNFFEHFLNQYQRI
jgi:hypothetical protein